MNKLFTFDNVLLTQDTICEKTNKVINYKEINVIANSEENARKEVARPKLDKDGILSNEYTLKQVFNLNKDWN